MKFPSGWCEITDTSSIYMLIQNSGGSSEKRGTSDRYAERSWLPSSDSLWAMYSNATVSSAVAPSARWMHSPSFVLISQRGVHGSGTAYGNQCNAVAYFIWDFALRVWASLDVVWQCCCQGSLARPLIYDMMKPCSEDLFWQKRAVSHFLWIVS